MEKNPENQLIEELTSEEDITRGQIFIGGVNIIML